MAEGKNEERTERTKEGTNQKCMLRPKIKINTIYDYEIKKSSSDSHQVLLSKAYCILDVHQKDNLRHRVLLST